MPYDAVDLFAGPGGWDEGARALGVTTVGVEYDHAACRTAVAAGHPRVRADVRTIPLEPFAGIPGLIGSPPCPTFSAAGKGSGRHDLPLLLEAITRLGAGEWPAEQIAACDDPRTALTLEPLRWALFLRPEWIVLEQVKEVLPVWEAMAEVLRQQGYSVATGTLQAEEYGRVWACPLHTAQSAMPSLDPATVPANVRASATTRYDSEWTPLAWDAVASWVQATRRDAASVATWLAHVQQEAIKAGAEPRTHDGQEGVAWTNEATSTFGLEAATAASIASSWRDWLAAQSLGARWSTTSMDRRITTIRAILSCIAATLTTGYVIGQATRAVDCGLCLDTAVPQTRRRAILVASRVRQVALPVPTHTRYRKGKPREAEGLLPWVSMADALGGGSERLRWTHDRPATTVVASFAADTIAGPGWRKAGDGPRQNAEGSVRVSVAEAGVLQSFPATYPWQGARTKQYQQVGNAVPPLLALAVLEAVL